MSWIMNLDGCLLKWSSPSRKQICARSQANHHSVSVKRARSAARREREICADATGCPRLVAGPTRESASVFVCYLCDPRPLLSTLIYYLDSALSFLSSSSSSSSWSWKSPKAKICRFKTHTQEHCSPARPLDPFGSQVAESMGPLNKQTRTSEWPKGKFAHHRSQWPDGIREMPIDGRRDPMDSFLLLVIQKQHTQKCTQRNSRIRTCTISCLSLECLFVVFFSLLSLRIFVHFSLTFVAKLRLFFNDSSKTLKIINWTWTDFFRG